MHEIAETVEERGRDKFVSYSLSPKFPQPSSLMALAPQTQTQTFNCNHNSNNNRREVAEVVVEEEEEIGKGTPIRYVPLCDLYSATSPCVSGSSNVLMSKKVKARKLLPIDRNHSHNHTHPPSSSSDLKRTPPPPPPSTALSSPSKPPITRFYSRHFPKRPRNSSHSQKPSFFDSLVSQSHSQSITSPTLALVKEEQQDDLEDFHDVDDAERLVQKKKRKKGKFGNSELIRLGIDSTTLLQLEGSRLRESRNHNYNLNNSNRRKRRPSENCQIPQMVNSASQRWVRLSFEGADSKKFIGLQCKVYWPLDADWYIGHVVGYNAETNRHHVAYEDGDEEDIILCNERIKFYVSCDEIQKLNLSCSTKNSDADGLDCNEMVVLAASFDDCHDLGSGDIIWAKLTGHAMWPAVVVDESLLKNRKGLNRNLAGKSIPVQFFGTHDFARVNPKHVISFLRGLLSSFHLKCKKPEFVQSLEEAKWYLSEQKLPKRMLRMQNSVEDDDCDSGSQEDESSELNSKLPSKPSLSNLAAQRLQDLPIGYRPVRVKWKDLDKCSVCHMDEEYENNLFLQCDKCRMMVHAKCYGELEPVDGVLWLCNLCCPGAPDFPPPCCLCPVTGGAMKPTTDGRWAHLACAIWIPETCLSDVKKMEPIDGLSRINKDRWKLLCSICGVSYGACIQCSNNTCRVAYHPLCARAAGFCVELEDEDRLHLISMDEDEDENEQCIRLVSFCKRHRPFSSARLIADDRNVPITPQCSDYSPPSNPSGCARSEPYNYFGRRGRKEPEALAAASSKRLFVENRPYLVSGYCQHKALGNTPSSTALAGSKFSFSLEKLKISQLDALESIFSMADKYKYMKETFRKRLAFGKSAIHGFGIFAKQPHRAGDMVIEYTGELVRPPVADRREHLIYNSLVGAGTYMFRIDDEHVIDATRAGSIAHLINHSCEPNCYSRVISVNGDEHIIIFAKRDIKQWEELTYDYRFFSIDEQLACYCGFPRCRGVVNDIEAEEQVAKLYVPRSELIDWSRE